MSERRRQKQARRQRRKSPRQSHSAAPRSRGASGRGHIDADRELEQLLASMAELAVADADAPADALEAEQWASSIIGTWHVEKMVGADVEELFFPGFTDALEALNSDRALALLRALGAVSGGTHGRRAHTAADRLAARGLAEPSWSHALGRGQPTAAALLHDECFDDGVSVMVEFADGDDEPHTLGIYIDHNLGGLVKDVFLAGPLAVVRELLARRAAEQGEGTICDLGLAEARAHVEAALYTLDHTLDPTVNEDVRPLRALIDTRMRLLPEGFALPEQHAELTPAEREELLAGFLASPEGRRWQGDEDAADAVAVAIDFGADYNHGGPLRWSPVVVEIFMTSWLARKVAREPEFFERVGDVLADWVAYAGGRRGVPAAALGDAVGAVELYRGEMLEATGDPGSWGPAKAFAVAAQGAGVDLSDPEAVERYVAQHNAGMER